MNDARHKVRFALRRQTPESELEWWPVRSQRVLIPNAATLRLFSYRSGPLVFITEEWTGVCVAFGPSLLYARREATRLIAEKTANGVRNECYEILKQVKPGKKPRLRK